MITFLWKILEVVLKCGMIIAASFLVWLVYTFVTLPPSTTKIVYYLTCSGVTIVENREHIYMDRSGSWYFDDGTYTPNQGEVCIVGHKEVQK